MYAPMLTSKESICSEYLRVGVRIVPFAKKAQLTVECAGVALTPQNEQ
jgi:hypothetical protein